MKNVLEIKNLCKSYNGFALKNVTFAAQAGKITGFIGRNGAGKSTTIGCALGLVKPSHGSITFFGKNVQTDLGEIKQQVGFVSSGLSFYEKTKISLLTKVTASFYDYFDFNLYRRLMRQFGIDENKTPSQLSQGMKIKYALVLALSHGAQLLILDEPTSGIDPVSRREILDIFLDQCKMGKTILFSTHVISDLETVADNIVYIKNGEIIENSGLKEFESKYKLCEFEKAEEADSQYFISVLENKRSSTALIKCEDESKISLPCKNATLEEIMLHLERREQL